jgi:hypothetical protein
MLSGEVFSESEGVVESELLRRCLGGDGVIVHK